MKPYFLLLLPLVGCGGAPQVTQQILDHTTRALVIADSTTISRLYAEAEEPCYQESETREEYDSCVEPANRLQEATEGAAKALRALQAAKDAWDAGAADGAAWYALAPCAVTSLAQLIGALQSFGADVPEELGEAITALNGFGGTCDG